MNLTGKTVVVVGGTSGIGLSAAKAIVGAGGNVVVVGRDQQKVDFAAAQLGQHGAGFSGDASDPQTTAQAIELAVNLFGPLDGLYHVAGGSGRRWGDGPLHAVSDEAITKTLELNLHSLILSNRAAVQTFLHQQSSGTILNTSSVLGFSPSPEHFASHVYAAAKSAIIGFTTIHRVVLCHPQYPCERVGTGTHRNTNVPKGAWG